MSAESNEHLFSLGGHVSDKLEVPQPAEAGSGGSRLLNLLYSSFLYSNYFTSIVLLEWKVSLYYMIKQQS